MLNYFKESNKSKLFPYLVDLTRLNDTEIALAYNQLLNGVLASNYT